MNEDEAPVADEGALDTTAETTVASVVVEEESEGELIIDETKAGKNIKRKPIEKEVHFTADVCKIFEVIFYK